MLYAALNLFVWACLIGLLIALWPVILVSAPVIFLVVFVAFMTLATIGKIMSEGLTPANLVLLLTFGSFALYLLYSFSQKNTTDSEVDLS
jgi:hypothetical protein